MWSRKSASRLFLGTFLECMSCMDKSGEFFFPTRVNNTSHPKSPNRPDGYDQPQDDQRVLRDYWSL